MAVTQTRRGRLLRPRELVAQPVAIVRGAPYIPQHTRRQAVLIFALGLLAQGGRLWEENRFVFKDQKLN